MVGAMTAVTATAQTAAAASPPARVEPRLPERSSSVLSADQIAKVRAVLSAYEPATLTADDAEAITRALRDAGMRRSAALDAAITKVGFSVERLESLDLRPPRPPSDGDAPAGSPPRK